MSTALLDSFQLIASFYFMYVAAKGHGQLYRFFDLSEHFQRQVLLPLRILYAVCGLICLADFGCSSLQSSMFTRELSGQAVTITQNYDLEALPFITYDLLSIISSVLTILLVLILVGILAWLRILSRRDK